METASNSKDVKEKMRSGKEAYAAQDRSFWRAATLQLVCASTIISGVWIVPAQRGINLINQPVETLQVFLVLALPVFLFAFSLLRLHPKNGKAWWAILRGLLGLPVGVVIAALVAILFGAPLPFEYAMRTLHWSALMSVLVVVPAATVLGSSWPSWFRIFAWTEPIGPVEIAICIPAHGAAIGAWVGAWPMPLDWDRPWQEWPVCCTYGAVMGYFVSLLCSLIWGYFSFGRNHMKRD